MVCVESDENLVSTEEAIAIAAKIREMIMSVGGNVSVTAIRRSHYSQLQSASSNSYGVPARSLAEAATPLSRSTVKSRLSLTSQRVSTGIRNQSVNDQTRAPTPPSSASDADAKVFSDCPNDGDDDNSSDQESDSSEKEDTDPLQQLGVLKDVLRSADFRDHVQDQIPDVENEDQLNSRIFSFLRKHAALVSTGLELKQGLYLSNGKGKIDILSTSSRIGIEAKYWPNESTSGERQRAQGQLIDYFNAEEVEHLIWLIVMKHQRKVTKAYAKGVIGNVLKTVPVSSKKTCEEVMVRVT